MRRERVVDGLVWAVVTAPVAGNYLTSGEYWRCLVAVAALTGAVLVARRAPLLGLLVVVLGTVFDGNFALAVPILSYLVGLRTERVRPVAVAFLVIAAAGTVLDLVVLRIAPAQWFTLALTLLLIGVFPWLVGRYQAQRARLVSAGWERAARLEYERQMITRQAQLRERARIAQEMHDSLGHELSLIALGAGALETTAGLPGEQRAAAERIRASAASATDRLREIIGVLGDDDPAPLEPPGEPVEALVARAGSAGLPVTLRRVGVGGPPAVERTAYGVVREALTNAGRHAPGAAVTVVLTRDGDATTVAVANGPAPRLSGDGTGLGLLGLRERVRLAGGSLTAGPTPEGGFRIVASLPHRPVSVPAVQTELRTARRRTRRSLAALLTPVVLAVVASVGYYSLATFRSVLDRDTFDRIAVGTPRTELAGLLPERQAWPESADGCAYYTDGNFPMAAPAYRLCFTGGRLATKARLR
jgi:signal transduction histidine kinase